MIVITFYCGSGGGGTVNVVNIVLMFRFCYQNVRNASLVEVAAVGVKSIDYWL